jgi:hypothetical protein
VRAAKGSEYGEQQLEHDRESQRGLVECSVGHRPGALPRAPLRAADEAMGKASALRMLE